MSTKTGKLDYSKRFLKQLKKSPLEIKISFRKRAEIFLQDQFNPQLNNHPLAGSYHGYRSINVTGDWRAVYFEENGTATFVALGTHSQLYK